MTRHKLDESNSKELTKQFSPDWWDNKDTTMAWCHRFCDAIEPPLTHNPDLYSTVGIVFFDKPDGERVPVGITALENDNFIFQYHPSYLNNPDLPPISVNLPKQAERFVSHGKLQSFFDNLLAEGWLGKEQATAAETDPLNVENHNESLDDRYKRLMMFARDCPGAVWVTYVKNDPKMVQKGHQEIINAALGSKASISGQQPKLLGIESQDGRLTPTNSKETSTRIIKLQTDKMPGLIEYEYMSITATKALLPQDETVDAKLTRLHLRDEPSRDVLSIKRFDRTEYGKLHFEEINQILDKPITERSHGDYLEIANAIRDKAGHEEVKKFYARLLSQFLLNNTDNHMKNFALMEQGDHWKMTPNYDLAPSSMYRLDEIESSADNPMHGHGIGGDGMKAQEKSLVLGIKGIQMEKRDGVKRINLLKSETFTLNQLNTKILVRLGRQFGLDPTEIRDIMEEIKANIPKAKEAVMNDPSPLLDQTTDAMNRSGYVFGRHATKPMRQDFCDRMEARSRQLFSLINQELGNGRTVASAG